MIASDALNVAIVSAVASIIAALVAGWNRRETAKVRKEASKAREKAEEAVDKSADNLHLDNGHTLADTVTDIRRDQVSQGRLLEATNGRVHDVSKRVDAQGRETTEIHREIKVVVDKLDAHVAEDQAGRTGELERRQDD